MEPNLGSDISSFLPYSLEHIDQSWCTVGEVRAGWISRERTKLGVECHLSGVGTPEDRIEGAGREIGLNK